MKKYLFLIAALFASSAFAAILGPENVNTNSNLNANTQGQSQGQVQFTAVGIDVSNRISNDTRSAASSFAQGGASGAVAASGGSTSGVNFEVNYPRAMGALGLGSLYPTAPCMGTSNIGGGNGFFTFGAGTSWTDDECGIRETSRSFNGMGMKDDALKVLCSSKYAAVAPSCMVAKPKE